MRRAEILNALPVLEAAKEGSGIAYRGFSLISRILEEESRVRGPDPDATRSRELAAVQSPSSMLFTHPTDLLADRSLVHFDPVPWMDFGDGGLGLAEYLGGEPDDGGMQLG